jgi:hypothetical protein
MSEIPWKIGEHEGMKHLMVEVHVCQDALGRVFSGQRLSEGSGEIAKSMKSGGEEQIAYCLAQEAIRREAFLECLVKLQDQGKEWFEEYAEKAEEEQKETRDDLCQAVARVLLGIVSRIGDDTMKEAIQKVGGVE